MIWVPDKSVLSTAMFLAEQRGHRMKRLLPSDSRSILLGQQRNDLSDPSLGVFISHIRPSQIRHLNPSMSALLGLCSKDGKAEKVPDGIAGGRRTQSIDLEIKNEPRIEV
jgi:hypothetical protein